MSTKKKMSDASKFLEKLTGGKLTLGHLILAIRQGEEISQVKFAQLLGVSRQYLCDIEHGRRFLSPRAASEFAAKLGYSQKQFLRLCLQELVDREELDLHIDVRDAA